MCFGVVRDGQVQYNIKYWVLYRFHLSVLYLRMFWFGKILVYAIGRHVCLSRVHLWQLAEAKVGLRA